MKRKHFSSFLLMGKVATLPLLIQSARADVVGSTQVDAVPAYTDIITSKVSVIAVPDSQVHLKNLTSDASTAYGANSYASALLCPSTANALPSTMSVVVTGVKAGDTVYLFGALDKNDPVNLAYNPKITIGNSKLSMLGQAVVSGTSGVTSAVTIPIDLNSAGNKPLVNAGRFYIQAATINNASPAPSQWGVSELDMIGVGQQQLNAYGQVTAYCV